MNMGRQTLVILLLVTAAFASPAYAQSQSLDIQASGTIAASCSLTKASEFLAANLSANGSVSATATVNCNTGFSIAAASANGAVKRVPPGTPPANFSNSLAYSFSLSVPLDSGGPAVANCSSAAMLANSCSLSSGGGTAAAKTATLTASWTIPVLPTRLLAGGYSDTITLTIAAVP